MGTAHSVLGASHEQEHVPDGAFNPAFPSYVEAKLAVHEGAGVAPA